MNRGNYIRDEEKNSHLTPVFTLEVGSEPFVANY